MIQELKTQILQSKVRDELPVKFIALDGHGGSGKTTLAKILAEELKAEVLHTDDFASFDKPMDWYQRLIDEVFKPIQNGAKKLSYEKGAWYKDHKPEPVVGQVVTPIIILEGVSSARKEFRYYLSYAVWIDTPLEECKRRGIERDLVENEANKSKAEIVADWDKWHAYELEYVKQHQPKEYVNRVVDGTIETYG